MRLKVLYEEKIIKEWGQNEAYKNVFAVPRLEKIVVNIGLGEAVQNPKVVETVSEQLSQITGQKPAPQVAKRAISSFRLKKGDKIGLKVTLRGKRMYDFLEKLIKIVLPRLRDFRGLSPKSFDGRGSYTLGIAEHSVFQELDFAKIDKVRGLEITIVTSAKTAEEAKRLLENLGMPFSKN